MGFIELITMPEFYDIFGLVVFTFLGWVALFALRKKQPIPKWAAIVMLCIAIAGLLVDGIIVITTFIK